MRSTNNIHNKLNNYDSRQDLSGTQKIDIQINGNNGDDANQRYNIVGFNSRGSDNGGENRLLSQINTKFNEQVKFNHN